MQFLERMFLSAIIMAFLAAMQSFSLYEDFFCLYEAYNHSTIDPLDLIEWSRVRLLMTWNFYLFFYISVSHIHIKTFLIGCINKYLMICICMNAIAVGIPRKPGKRERKISTR
jgi:hypothetical protein